MMKRVKARLPQPRTLEQFDFLFPSSIDEMQVRELFTCAALDQGKNIIFSGPPGVGKTHLAIALSLAAIEHGLEVKYETLDHMLSIFRGVYHDGAKTLRLLRSFMLPDVVVFDDIDYYQANEDESIFLFEIVKKRTPMKKSMIFTTNNPLSEWKGLFKTPSRTNGALDRIKAQCINVPIDGKSYRKERGQL